MKLAAFALLALLAAVHPVPAQEESDSPHRVLKPDGETDTEKCGICHQGDMSLSQPKSEICKMCHAVTIHSGAAEHLQTSPTVLARLLPAKKEGATELPLTEEGGIFCGTCHLFHDPRVVQEKGLTQSWVPPATGLAGAVRTSLATQWNRVASKYGESGPGAKFSSKSTRALRLPVSDGSLCRTCHGNPP